MGNCLTNWAKEQSAGSGGAKAVLLCLCDTAKDYERGRVIMTQQQIAGIIEFDKRSVMRWLDKLEGKLVTRVKSKKSDGTNNPNVYQILCPSEIFDTAPSDTESPSQPDIVTESHYLSDRESLPSGEIPSETAEIEPIQVTDSHLELSDTQSPFTVLEEEELLDKKLERENAGANFEFFAETERLIDEGLRKTTNETLFWVQTQQNISRQNFPVSEWLDLIVSVGHEGINAGEGFKDFYIWVESQHWVEIASPKLMKGQIAKYKNRDKIEAKKQVNKDGISQNGKSNYSHRNGSKTASANNSKSSEEVLAGLGITT